jgi:hypothetical protein
LSLNSFLKVSPLLALGLALSAQAGTITASGAGALPATAQDLTGLSPTEILGTITDQLGVNMFKISIVDPVAFSAITVATSFGIPDTVLFLFDSNGNGVYANDDLSGSNTLSCLPSADAGNPCVSSRPSGVGPASAGIYYLAITRSANFPLSGGSEIFSPLSSTDVVGPALSGSNPVDGWDNNAFTSSNFDLVNYDILLTGTTGSTVPEPTTRGVVGAVGLLLVFIRWRFASRQKAALQ